MGEKNDCTKEFEVPFNYYVDIHGGPSMTYGGPSMACGHFENSRDGDCYITVYKSLDKSRCPPVEHLVRAGNFLLKDTQNMKVGDFLKAVRQGIEKIVDADKTQG